MEELKKVNKVDGTPIGAHDELKIRNNDERKVRIIDNLFKSLANLIYFFEFLNLHQDLITKFSDDIEDLLGLKGGGPRNPEGEVFPRFVTAVLDIGSVGYDDDSRFNFRRRMLKILQYLINQKAMLFITNSRNEPRGYDDTQFRDMIYHDFKRAQVWMNYLDRLTGHETKKPKRIIGF